jgi:hemerythrin HHE cation binding domain-containing protein
MSESPKDAVALLKADHRKVEKLFESFKSVKQPDRKMKLAKEICTELMIHATIEEEIFYPACKGEVDDDKMAEAYVEHDGAKVMIAEILASGPDDGFFDAKVTVLSEEIKHHVKEEEAPSEGVFAQAKKAGLDMDELGARLLARKQELMAKFKSERLPPPETRSFTGHELKQGAPVDKAA